MSAHEIVTLGAPRTLTGGDEPWVSVKVECSACKQVFFTGHRQTVVEARESWIPDHIAQHGPGRALDIAVDWEPVAYCTVCDDGIGDIVQESEGLECRECGSTWDMDGRGGETSDDDD